MSQTRRFALATLLVTATAAGAAAIQGARVPTPIARDLPCVDDPEPVRPPSDREVLAARSDAVLALPEPEPELDATIDTTPREVFSGPRDGHRVALTFDDGPSRENTPRILEVLAEHDARATFFVLGDRAAKMPDLVARVYGEGHEIGNHSYSHGSLRSMWASQIRSELDETNAAIAHAIGRSPALFRPPFGRYAPSALDIIGEARMNVVLWSVDGQDWDREPEAIAASVVRAAGPGDIVLLHDRTSRTVHALPAIIRGLRARGLELVTVSELTGLPAYRSPR